MSIAQYQKIQNTTDSAVQLSIRAVRSILLYCQDWSNKALSKEQKMQSIAAGQVLCDSLVLWMNNELAEIEQHALMVIFTQTSIDLHKCEFDPDVSLIENERALIKILSFLES